MNKFYVILVMVVGFTERSRQYWQFQMATHLAVRNKKQGVITRERKLFSEIRQLKPLSFSEDLAGKFDLLYTRRTLARDKHTDKNNYNNSRRALITLRRPLITLCLPYRHRHPICMGACK